MIKLIRRMLVTECGIRTRFGIYCPGCGGTRAVWALFDGNILQSLRYNPTVFLFIIDIVLAASFLVAKKKHSVRLYKLSQAVLIYNWVLLICIVAYSILRNILLLKFGIDMLGDFS